MIYTSSIWMLPILLASSAVDLYLGLAFLRLGLGAFSSGRPARLCRHLVPLTDWAPATVQQWMASRRTSQLPSWIPWLVVIAVGLLLRHVLLAVALGAARPT